MIDGFLILRQNLKQVHQSHYRPPAALRPHVQKHMQLRHWEMNFLHLLTHHKLRLHFL